MKNEERIKDAIMKGYDAGRCDKDGNTIPVEKRGAGKGSRSRIMNTEKYKERYDLIDWSIK